MLILEEGLERIAAAVNGTTRIFLRIDIFEAIIKKIEKEVGINYGTI